MAILLGIAAVVAAVIAAQKAKSASMPAKLPADVKGVMAHKRPTRDELGRAAESADKSGYPQLAAALRARAKSAPDLIASPWVDVDSAAWTRFCRTIIADNRPGTFDPRGFYGMFRLGVRRLVDLGIMTNPRSRNVVTPDRRSVRVWNGDFIIDREKFMTSPGLQYQAFEKSMQLYRMIVSEKYKQVVGLPIENRKATLSGLLALCHAAGSEGMGKWLLEREYRRKFKHVTEAYLKANGIF